MTRLVGGLEHPWGLAFLPDDRMLVTERPGRLKSEATATTLFRAQLEDDRLVECEELFTQDRRSQPGRHYGSRLAFLPDGTLLMTIGDRGFEPERAQDLEDHAGSVLRRNDDGSVPDDNPFVDRDDALPEIYFYGHRNIQGCSCIRKPGRCGPPSTGRAAATNSIGSRRARTTAGRGEPRP